MLHSSWWVGISLRLTTAWNKVADTSRLAQMRPWLGSMKLGRPRNSVRNDTTLAGFTMLCRVQQQAPPVASVFEIISTWLEHDVEPKLQSLTSSVALLVVDAIAISVSVSFRWRLRLFLSRCIMSWQEESKSRGMVPEAGATGKQASLSQAGINRRLGVLAQQQRDGVCTYERPVSWKTSAPLTFAIWPVRALSVPSRPLRSCSCIVRV